MMVANNLFFGSTTRMKFREFCWLFICVIVLVLSVIKTEAQTVKATAISDKLLLPENPEKPWVFWYWMQAAVSKEGITADLEAMKKNGIGGAYLMPIKGVANPLLMEPAVPQLSPLFWEMVKFSMQEADRLGLQIGMHFSDGFALGGGPWITPELSMQKVVFREQQVKGGTAFNAVLERPNAYEDYYHRIAVLAYPTINLSNQNTYSIKPVVTTSNGLNASFLINQNNKEAFKSNDSCWIQYSFEQPFTCRSINIKTKGNNYQAQRLIIQSSEDGISFKTVTQLKAPRHGWQDTDADFTYSIVPVEAKFFRFVYSKNGSEPGAEDLDAAKWKAGLKLTNIELSGKPQINQYEAKAGFVWRVADRTTQMEIADSLCVPLEKIIDLTSKVDAAGKLVWQAPAGDWTILEIGATSTGQTNATGGAGSGLECDKFNPDAVKLQFSSWFGEAVKQVGPELAEKVLKVFHVDSWECGSQNWSPVFREEFRKRRGYDLLKYLPAMAGIPVQSADVSERFLYDVRQTIVELVNDNFYTTLQALSHEKGCTFTAESIAPTMVSDGLLHYNKVDVPMGEFWLNSPTHDKPNDMLDAISGAHIYGKPIIQAEAFTTVRMAWNEHPGMMKSLQDYNYAMGINRLVYHVFAHNPWPERKPGMTLDGVGLYFQRNQTWWDAGKAWVEYAERCQKLLQQGGTVTDIAVFTGEEIPRRSILPDRLVSSLPGLFGSERVQVEATRLENKGQPVAEQPAGVWHSANMSTPQQWINPLHGYKYDCINPDALLRLAAVKNGRIVLAGGASYGVLVIPGSHPMQPNASGMSLAVATKLLQLITDGATVIFVERPTHSLGLQEYKNEDNELQKNVHELWFNNKAGLVSSKQIRKGKIIYRPFTKDNLNQLGIEQDVIFDHKNNTSVANIEWTHRKDSANDIYFISNQDSIETAFEISLRVSGKQPELYDAVTDETTLAGSFKIANGRTILPLKLAPNQSLFILLKKPAKLLSSNTHRNYVELKNVALIQSSWTVQFDKGYGGPASPVNFPTLTDWSKNSDSSIHYYSGTAVYSNTFNWNGDTKKKAWLLLGTVCNLAQVKVNGIDCGTAWTYPYQVDISKAVKKGVNQLEIAVTNTWANRLIGDNNRPANERITNTTAPFRLAGKPLQPAGLLGPVSVQVEVKK
jgi:hypothetical protein